MNYWVPIASPGKSYPLAYKTIDQIDKLILQNMRISANPLIRDLAIKGYSSIDLDLGLSDFRWVEFQEQMLSSISDSQAQMVLHYLTSSRKLKEILQCLYEYIPLDAVDIIKVTNFEDFGSDFWHRDGVGNRIKIFIPLRIQGKVSPTEVFEASHLDSCWPQHWELVRCGKIRPDKDPSQRIIDMQLSQQYGSPKKLEWEENNCIALNTNTVHRAGTFSNTNESQGFRYFVSMEFMNKETSLISSKLELGRVRSTISNCLLKGIELICKR